MFHRDQVSTGNEMLEIIAEGGYSAETHYLLPVTEFALKWAQSSDHEIMAMYSYRLKTD